MQITPLTSVHFSRTATMLAAAFADEPIVERMIPHTATRRAQRVAAYFRWSMKLTGFQNIDIALDEKRTTVLGAALWEPPGHRAHQLRAMPQRFGAWRALGRRGFQALHEYELGVAPFHPKGPHWHLVDIGTSPAARGRGVGSELLQYRLQKIDEREELASLAATTHASRNLYERHGFSALHEICDGTAAGLTVMTRPARKPVNGTE